MDVEIAGRGGLPTSGIGGVFLNVTVVYPSAAGYLTVWPTGDAQPNASSLNHRAGQTVANNVFVAVGSAGGGRVSVFSEASAHVIVDVVGWVPTGAVPIPTRPARLADTRPGASTVDGVAAGRAPIRSQASLDIQVTGRAGIPSSGVGAAIVNITAVDTKGSGFITAWPTGARRPDASVLNYTTGAIVANGTIVPIGDGGRISLYSWSATDVIVDVVGWIPGVTPQPAKVHGINLSPFLGTPKVIPLSDGFIHELTDRLTPYTEWIRTYECSGFLGRFPVEARRAGMKVVVGAWMSQDEARNRREIECVVSLANGGYADMVVVGSETLRNGTRTEAQLLAHLADVNARVQVPVTTAETDATLRARPNIIAAVDVVFANIYPYWVGIPIEQAATNLAESYARLQAVSGGRQVIISETGWPTCTAGVGAAVPSVDNAARYIREVSAWAKTNGVSWFWFSAYDEAAKTGEPVEKCWGAWTVAGERKYVP